MQASKSVVKRPFVVPKTPILTGNVASDTHKPLSKKAGIEPSFVPSTEGEMAACLDGEHFSGFVYYIASIETGRVYVGSTIRTVKQRWSEHLHYLRKGTHHSPHLQRVFDKYGEDDLHIGAIAEVYEESALLPLEQFHIDKTRGMNMNGSQIANSVQAANEAVRGRKMSDEEKARRAESRKRSIASGTVYGGAWTDERRARHSVCLTGRQMPPVAQSRLQSWIDLRKEGNSYAKIGELTGNSRHVISRECQKVGL